MVDDGVARCAKPASGGLNSVPAQYEHPWRPSHELWAASAWLTALPLMLLAARAFPVPAPALAALLTLCVAAAGLRSWQGLAKSSPQAGPFGG